MNAFLRWPLMLLPFALWGTAMAAMKPLLDSLSPPSLAWLRLLPAGLALLLATVVLRRPLAVDPRDRPWLLAFALVDGSLFQLLLAAGLADTGAGLGSVLIDSQPLLVALLARTVLGEAINPVGWVGLLIGLAGIACLGLPAGLLRHWWLLGPPLPTVEALGRGELLMLLAAAAMAVGTILARRACRHSDPVAVTAWHLLVGALPPLVLAALPAFGGWQGLWPSLAPGGWLLVAYAALPGSALAYGLFFWFASQGDLTGFTSLTFLTPVFALLSAGLLLHESLRPLQWLGVVLALASVLLINRRAVLWQPPTSLQPERI